MAEPNEEMRRGWAESASGWVANERIVDHAFVPVTGAVLEAAQLGPTLRVLDVGCGSGTLLAAAVERGADAVGVDIAPGMAEAAQARVPGALVAVGDAQTDDLLALAGGGPAFDRVVSRFGVMFFSDPTAAFGNIRAATSPGGRLAAAVWRSAEENPVFTLGSGPLLERIEVPSPAPGAPGPTALADPTRTRGVLEGAGWTAVEISPLDVTLDYGLDGSDGVEERLAVTLASGTGRIATAQLRPRMPDAEWAALLEAAREEIRAARVDGVVRIPGAVWVVTATA
ncbi:class I SAM-dependent methyltransferase [Pseudactinotalea suaedae]|uniref:class I SAM-dependent methyltransferase n=1 Tax=Pseudactinotalea suaedae TaxID=1524924 RepID=UPI0019D5050E|nr:class I SAM-dependent methyltransferase [Pseudactinotalea suaedae]